MQHASQVARLQDHAEGKQLSVPCKLISKVVANLYFLGQLRLLQKRNENEHCTVQLQTDSINEWNSVE